ncbi:flavodoxin family protein [Paenibacillus sp. 7124]|uniref:Flavodoxin family protein n=1 Tax=Paenibacillus apii TaxID=1850370 RepID=A0A6M1PK88_9BACL|nr:flavodoxin family protein [Paenibacillus apii]NGM82735.1 flavodoxin family protein [Paenibacillus apii]NJJ39876.1 flavodoxin family protein [Paenibacillus apii]
MATKRLLAIKGGPRPDGITAKMLQIAVQAAKAAGWETDFCDLYEVDITACKGCPECRATGVCPPGGELAELWERLASSDLVILSAPTYYANVPGQVKLLFDRLAGKAMDRSGAGLAPKPTLSSRQQYLLMTACNTPFPLNRMLRQSSACLAAMNEFFRISGMTRKGQVVCAGAKKLTEVPARLASRIESFFLVR